MIPTSFTGRVISLIIGFVSVGVVIRVLMGPPEQVELDGGASTIEASLGSSFADMVQGATPPEEPNDTVEPNEPEPVEDTEVTEETPPEEVTETEPEEVTETEPEEVKETEREEVDAPEEPVETVEIPREVEIEETEAEPVENAVVVETEQLQVNEAITALTVAPQVAEPLEPEEPEIIEQIEVLEPEVLEAEETETAAVTRSLRPKPRTPEFEEKNKPEPQPVRQQTRQTQQPAAQPRVQQGNNQTNATRGVATAQQTNSRATNSGTARSQAQGNAAAANYPGLVMRRINRVSRPRGVGRGTARVAFTVSASGGLAGVSLARSSGVPALDQAALRMIQRAAPFPPPPPGAQRRFSLNIEGR